MNRPKLLITGLATTVFLLSGVMVLRSSGLATHPMRALAALPHGAWVSPYTAPDGVFTATMWNSGVQWEGTYGNLIDKAVYHFGVYEKGEVNLLLRLARVTGGDLLDIGANVGNHSFALAPEFDTVQAVEPWPPVLERLRQVQQANPQITNVRIHPVGYSNEPGTLPYFAPPASNLGTGSFDPTFSDDNSGEAVLLPLVVGDGHIDEVGAGRIGVVKCDIEGFERYALEGLRQTLLQDRPAVVFELNLTEGGFTSLEQLQRTFPPRYEFHEISLEDWLLDFGLFGWFYGSSATGRYHLTPLSDFHRSNVLALPAERNLFDALR